MASAEHLAPKRIDSQNRQYDCGEYANDHSFLRLAAEAEGRFSPSVPRVKLRHYREVR